MLRAKAIGCCAAGVVMMIAGAAYAQTVGVQPGMWETVTKITSAKGAPPGMAAMMNRPRMIRNCVTPTQARQGLRNMLSRNTRGSCSYKRLAMAGGRLNYEMICTGDGGRGGMTINASGTYSPSAYNVASKMVMSGRMNMTIASVTQARRVGPCKG